MKKLLIITMMHLFVGGAMLSAQAVAVSNPVVSEVTKKSPISWDQTKIDLGEIPRNVPAVAEFTLINQSDEALLINEVKTTCGCTVAGYSREPIAPGASTKISATYNAKKVGAFTKVIKVYTTAGKEAIPLTIKGQVQELKAN